MKNKKIIIGLLLIIVFLVLSFLTKNALESKKTKDFLLMSIENSTYQIGESSVDDFVKNGWKISDENLQKIPKNTSGTLPMIKDDKVIIVIWNNTNNDSINNAKVSGICIDKKFEINYKYSDKCEELYQILHKRIKKLSGNTNNNIIMKEKYYDAFISVNYDVDEIVTIGTDGIAVGVSKESFNVK